MQRITFLLIILFTTLSVMASAPSLEKEPPSTLVSTSNTDQLNLMVLQGLQQRLSAQDQRIDEVVRSSASVTPDSAVDESLASLQRQLTNYEKRLDAQDERIGDVGLYLAFFGGFLTVLIIFFALFSIRTVKREASEAVDLWFKKGDGKNYIRDRVEPELDKALLEIKQAAEPHIEVLGKQTQIAEGLNKQLYESLKVKGSEFEKIVPLTQEQVISEGMEQELDAKPQNDYQFSDWFTVGLTAYDNEDFENALKCFNHALDMAQSDIETITVLVNKGAVLGELGRSNDEISIYDEIIDGYSNIKEPDLQVAVAQALFNKGATLKQLGRIEEAIAEYEEFVSFYRHNTELFLRTKVAQALVNKGVLCDQLARSEEAIAIYDEVITQYGVMQESDLHAVVAQALLNKGVILNQSGKNEDALAIYDQVTSLYGISTEFPLQLLVARALFNKAVTLAQMKQGNEAIVIYNEIVNRNNDSSELLLKVEMIKALFYKGIAKYQLGYKAESIGVYDEIQSHFRHSQEFLLQEWVVRALYYKGWTLGQMMLPGGEVATYSELISSYGNNPEPIFQEQVVNALNGIGFNLLCAAKESWANGDVLVAKSTLAQALENFNKASSEAPDYAHALGNKGYALFLLGQEKEARTLLKKALELGDDAFRAATLADAEIHPLPQDKAFKKMINSL